MNPSPWETAPPPERAAEHMVQALQRLTPEQVAIFAGIVALGVAGFFASLWLCTRLQQIGRAHV